jgi:hypothetical protein
MQGRAKEEQTGAEYANTVAKLNNRAVLLRQSTEAEVEKALICNLFCRRGAALPVNTTSIIIFSPL